MGVKSEIRRAERVFAGTETVFGGGDPRRQVLIDLNRYIEAEPEALWDFALRWGQSPDDDLRIAIATCLLEHLLADHFDLLFPRVEAAVRASPSFGHCFRHCWTIGQANLPANEARFDALKASIAAHAV